MTTTLRTSDIHSTPSSTPKFMPFLSEEDAKRRAQLIKALSDPNRLRILSLLKSHEGAICVSEMVECFRLEQPTISHHLRILAAAGLIDNRKKGLYAYYYLDRQRLMQVMEHIDELM